MEGLAWLLLKMAALLALAGVAFFSLGWWLRGKQPAPQDESLANELEQLKSATRAVEAERDAARKQLGIAEAQIESAEVEITRLQLLEQAYKDAQAAAPDLVLSSPDEAPAPPKPKAPRKPRAKKSKV